MRSLHEKGTGLMGLMTGYESTGQCIRAVRERRGLSQRELARALGWHAPTLNRYENERRTITAPRLQDIATALLVPIHLLYPQSCTCKDLAQVHPFPTYHPEHDAQGMPMHQGATP